MAQHSAEASAFCSVLSNIAPRSERSGAAPTQASAFSRCPARIRLSRSLSLTGTDQRHTAPLGVQAGSRAQYRPPSRSRLAPYEHAQRRAAAQHRAEASAFCSVLNKMALLSVRAAQHRGELLPPSRFRLTAPLFFPVGDRRSTDAGIRPLGAQQLFASLRECRAAQSRVISLLLCAYQDRASSRRAGAAPSSGAAQSRGISLLLSA